MKRLLIALLALVLVVSPVSAADKLPAVGPAYEGLKSGERVVEVQSWWTEFGHIHATAVIPKVATGEISVPIRAILHNNPSVIHTVRLVMRDGEAGKQVELGSQNGLNWTCPYSGKGNKECSFDQVLKIDTAKYYDGLKQLVVRVEADTPDKREFHTSSRIPIEFDNSRRTNGDALPKSRVPRAVGCTNTSALGRGWYEVSGGIYSDAEALCVPSKPISGVWRQKFVGDNDISHLNIALSATHAIPPGPGKWLEQAPHAGKVIFDKAGRFTKPFEIKIDTRQLQNGIHTMAIRSTRPESEISKCDYCLGIKSQVSGVMKYWFEVKN
jgi:hypothetical protein